MSRGICIILDIKSINSTILPSEKYETAANPIPLKSATSTKSVSNLEMKGHFRSLFSLSAITLYGVANFIPSIKAAPTIEIDKSVSNGLKSRQYSIPGPPPDPQLQPGDGAASGKYNSASWGPADYITIDECYAMVAAAATIGWPNAAEHMSHYLENSGTEFQNNVDTMMKDLINFRTAVHALAQDSAKAAYTGASASGPDSSQTFQTPWVQYGYDAGNFDNKDWFFADGAFSYSLSGEVSISKAGKISLAYVVHVFDRYNWDKGKSTTIGRITITDEQIGHLNMVGWARDYIVRGTSTVNTIDPYDPAKALPLPSTSGAGRDRVLGGN